MIDKIEGDPKIWILIFDVIEITQFWSNNFYWFLE